MRSNFGLIIHVYLIMIPNFLFRMPGTEVQTSSAAGANNKKRKINEVSTSKKENISKAANSKSGTAAKDRERSKSAPKGAPDAKKVKK
jgi:hypothetical protein